MCMQIREGIQEEARIQAGSWKDLFSSHEHMGYRTFLGVCIQVRHYAMVVS